ncbi:MAG: hypothetical protein ACYTE5_04920 [Planctomycetota bacterium]|jgi:hypothetical protein
MALYEICTAPPEIPRANVLKMLAYWSSKYHHETKGIVVEAAKPLINNMQLPERQALAALDEIASYPGFYNAVVIVCSTAVPENGNIQRKYDAIVKQWRQLS